MTDETKIVNDNQQSQRVDNRANDTRQDDTDTAPITVTLHTIDSAILNYMNNRVKPIVTQGGVQLQVPVIYGSPERWKSAQRDGILRDSIGKIQLPMIMIRRTNMKKTRPNSPVNKYFERTFYTGWNRRTPYDRFAVANGVVPSREYYTTAAAPDYYEMTYQCIIWTEYMEQMNAVVENVSFESDEFWGEPNQYKFRTIINAFQPATDLPTNADRVVRTQFNMTVFGYLLPETGLDVGHNRGQITRKRYGVKKVVTFTEIDN